MNLHKQIISLLSESSSEFAVSDISHEPDMIMCLVLGDDEGADDYYGINVLFMKDGEVDLSTYDKLAEKQAADHKDEIIRIAKAVVMKDPDSRKYMKELGHE